MNIKFTEVAPDVIAGIVLLTFVGYVGCAILGLFGATLTAISAGWMALYSTVVLMSAVKLYGKKTLTAVRNAGGKLVKVDDPSVTNNE